MLKLIILVLLCSNAGFSAFNLPSNLNAEKAKIILDNFGAGFVIKVPFYSRDTSEEKALKAHLHASLSLIETDDVEKLGSGISKDPIQSQLVHFGLELPFQVDLGLQTSLISVDNRIQQFGGFVRWLPYRWSGLNVTTTLHGSSVDIKSQLATNLYGAMVGFDYQLEAFNFFASTGFLRSTSSFQGTLFSPVSLSRFTLAREYSHQVFRLSYKNGLWTLSGQSDWIKKFHHSVLIGYLF